MSGEYSRDIIDELMKNKIFKLEMENVSIYRNDNGETEFFSFPYHRNSRNFGKNIHFQGIEHKCEDFEFQNI